VSNINLDIKPGEWLCLMGASGSGKSTLTNLLTRFYEPKSGTIRIDGLPLERVKLASLRSHMVLVPQEPQIFSGTIADNICYGINHYSPVEIMAAAKAADLHETIMQMPAKYETILGEKGVTLSGGQRQRLSLARALIADPKILILDDCTSALDARTEKQIQQTLSRVMQDRTSIIVSQRVSMAQHCHKTIVLDKGRIAESGTHEELLKLGGLYAEFYRLQTES
jgi:ATP-binding cassette subfamily B protein